MHGTPRPKPPLSTEDKTGQGSYNNTTGCLLCPVNYDWSNTKWVLSVLTHFRTNYHNNTANNRRYMSSILTILSLPSLEVNASWTSTTTFPFGKSLKKASSPLWSPYPLCPVPLRHWKGLSCLPKGNFLCSLYPSNYSLLSPPLLCSKPFQLVLDHQSWAQSRPNLLSSYHPHLLQEGWSQSHTLDRFPISFI